MYWQLSWICRIQSSKYLDLDKYDAFIGLDSVNWSQSGHMQSHLSKLTDHGTDFKWYIYGGGQFKELKYHCNGNRVGQIHVNQ